MCDRGQQQCTLLDTRTDEQFHYMRFVRFKTTRSTCPVVVDPVGDID
jgi:hypothetical protein